MYNLHCVGVFSDELFFSFREPGRTMERKWEARRGIHPQHLTTEKWSCIKLNQWCLVEQFLIGLYWPLFVGHHSGKCACLYHILHSYWWEIGDINLQLAVCRLVLVTCQMYIRMWCKQYAHWISTVVRTIVLTLSPRVVQQGIRLSWKIPQHWEKHQKKDCTCKIQTK